jgi:uncharacterized protein YjbJ (UPF0337 family)
VERSIDWNRISGLWTEYQGIVKANWGRLTDNDMTAISGNRDLLIGKLQTRYGLTTDQAERQVDDWVATLAVTAGKPLTDAAEYLSVPANYAASALTDAAKKSIRENKALVFGVTAITCFALGYFWNKLVR